MNKKRGFYCMPPVNLGLHFDGIGYLPRLKLHPKIARKMLLEAHRWTAEEAVKEGVIDEAVEPENMMSRAIELARELAPRAKMGVYALLRNELYGEASRQLQQLTYRHHRPASLPPRVKI
jgi:enoyl-CoA hydratase/carnithine racemase